MKQAIELRKIRDFGQVINDSFTFLKENFKPLFKMLLVICGIFIILGSISTVFTYMHMSSIFTFNINRYDSQSRALSYGISVLISTLLIFITQAFIHLVTLCYISVYVEKKNATPTLPEVWGYFRYYFFRVVGGGFLVFLVIVIGCFFCLIPGIYLSIVFSLLIPVIVIENGSFSYAFNKCFALIKDHWWLVFGVIFIMTIIISIAGSIASIPLTVVTVGSKFFSTKVYSLPLIILFSVLKNILLLLYVLPATAVSLCYLSLSEEKEGTGLLGRISRFGANDNNDLNQQAEEY